MFYSGFNIIRKTTTQKWSKNRLDSIAPVDYVKRKKENIWKFLSGNFPWGNNKEEKYRKNRKNTKFEELLICGCRNIHDGQVIEFNFDKLFLRVSFLKARRDENYTPIKGLPYNCMYKFSIYKLGV